jgi:hypothetical protein
MNEQLQVLKIPKSTGTHADVLAAVGLASLLSEIPALNPVMIEERETEFGILCAEPFTESELRYISHSPGYLYLRPNAKADVPESIHEYLDYPAEVERVERYWKQREVLRRRQLNDSELKELLQADMPRDDWELWRALNNLQGDETTNRVYLEISTTTESKFREAVESGLRSLRNRNKSSGLRWNITQSMLFCPTSAKGYRELKPQDTKRKNYKIDQWADPFVEWLKYRGYFRCAFPRLLGKDVRVLVPVPHRISLRGLESAMRELRQAAVYGGAPKTDSLAVLRLAEILIRHSEEYHDPTMEPFPGLSITNKAPADLVSGIITTHYQSLGSAKAVMQMSLIAIPGWFSIRNADEATLWLTILREQQHIVQGLRDDRSDEVGLLIAYRAFLQVRGEIAFWTLVEFMEKYGTLVMRVNGSREGNRVRWLARFTTEHFRRIAMEANRTLGEILTDPGFEAVARAVRQATVTAQNKKARKEDVWREIRYELLHDIHRTRKVPGNAFIECISEFISRYNYENARRREIKKDVRIAPPNVTDEQLKSFMSLVFKHGASVVGALLAAYGTCKEKWEPEEDAQSNNQQTSSS